MVGRLAVVHRAGAGALGCEAGGQEHGERRGGERGPHVISAGRAKPEAPGMIGAGSVLSHCSSSAQ